MKENSQRFVASSSKEPDLENLLSLELARGEGKTQKKLGDFICIRQKNLEKQRVLHKKIRVLERKSS